jgi:hypothetical protein
MAAVAFAAPQATRRVSTLLRAEGAREVNMAYDKPDFGDDELNDFSRFEDEEELGADREETIEEEEAAEEELSVDEHSMYAPPPTLPAATSAEMRKTERKAGKSKRRPKKKKLAKPKKKAKRRGKARSKRRRKP